jgi:mannosyl-3-phosphoglycerate phosphatase
MGDLLKLEFSSMSEMSTSDVASATGLSEDHARLAQDRSFDLAFVVRGAFDLGVLEAEVKGRGLKLTRGARFLHLTGDIDKGRAVARLAEFFETQSGDKLSTIGLGDSENDLPMLREVDIPVIIPNPGSEAPVSLDAPNLVFASHPGPKGWNEVVLSLLKA